MKAFYGTFINAIELDTVIVLVLSIAAAVAFVYVAVKGAKIGLAMLKGA